MYARVIVPLDGGPFSARALGPALKVAAASEAPLSLVSFALTVQHRLDHERAMFDIVENLDHKDVSVKVARVPDIAAAIAREVHDQPDALVCMSSVGRAHSAPWLGSVAEGVLADVTTPVLLVGPNVDVDAFDLSRPLLVCVDGSAASEAVLPIAASWSSVFHMGIRVVTVNTSLSTVPDGVANEAGYVRRVALGLQAGVGQGVDFDVLHGRHPVSAIIADASATDSSVIVAATHGAGGFERVVVGSVTAGLVHRADRPVLACKPLPRLLHGAHPSRQLVPTRVEDDRLH